MISSLYLSFTDYSILGSPKWVGLKNYAKMFTKDSKYLKSLKVTFFYAFASVPLKLLMALVVAMIMTKKTKLTGIYRAVYYLPSIIGGSVAVAVMWKQLFSSSGVINSVLQALGLDVTISWIGNPKLAIWGSNSTLCLAIWLLHVNFSCWSETDSKSYYEAARVDGASAAKSFSKLHCHF